MKPRCRNLIGVADKGNRLQGVHSGRRDFQRGSAKAATSRYFSEPNTALVGCRQCRPGAQEEPQEQVRLERPPDEAPAEVPLPVEKPPEKAQDSPPPAPVTAKPVKAAAPNVGPSWLTPSTTAPAIAHGASPRGLRSSCQESVDMLISPAVSPFAAAVVEAHGHDLLRCLRGKIGLGSQSSFAEIGSIEIAAHKLHDQRGRISD
jgi:hypothetical protein